MEHTFSVEIKSKKYLKNISISDEAPDRVLFEGNLGTLLELTLADDVLEFTGGNGVLRVGLTEEQLRKALKQASQVQPKLRGMEPHDPKIKEAKRESFGGRKPPIHKRMGERVLEKQ